MTSTPWLFAFGDVIPPSCVGIKISHEIRIPINQSVHYIFYIMECYKGFECCSVEIWRNENASTRWPPCQL